MKQWNILRAHVVCACAVLVSAIISGPSAASLVILSNDSYVSASVSTSVIDSTYSFTYDSDSDSNIATYAGATGIPGSFGGTTVTADATSTDEFGDSSVWHAFASMSVDMTTPDAATTVIDVAATGGAYESQYSLYDDYGAASVSEVFDLTFTVDTPTILDLYGENNGTGRVTAGWSLTNLSTSTTLFDQAFGIGVYIFGYEMLDPGTYRLVSEFNSACDFCSFSPYIGQNVGYYTATFSDIPTPVPPAIWLFVSGLVPLFMRRRRAREQGLG